MLNSEAASSHNIPENIWAEFTPAIQSRITTEYNRIKQLASRDDFIENETVLWTTAMLECLGAIQSSPSVAHKRKNLSTPGLIVSAAQTS